MLDHDTFRIIRRLGHGGFGAVYLVEHVRLNGIYYAIKELTPETMATAEEQEEAERQFCLEASILAKLSHDGLPKVWHYFIQNGRSFLVMDYVDGETLAEHIARIGAPLAETQVLEWAGELCDAVIYLHSQTPPIIHRDINPSNIKLTPDGHVKLLDFGIAKLMLSGGRTVSPAKAVTPPFSPLEQYGTGPGTDVRSDIYSLGATLYQCLAGALPPEAPERATVDLVPPRQLNPALSDKVDQVILRALALKPENRYPTCIELKKALQSAHPQLVIAPEQQQAANVASSQILSAAPPQRSRVGIMAALALSVALVIAFAVLLYRETEWSGKLAQVNMAFAAARTTATADTANLEKHQTLAVNYQAVATDQAKTIELAQAAARDYQKTGTAQAQSIETAQNAIAADLASGTLQSQALVSLQDALGAWRATGTAQAANLVQAQMTIDAISRQAARDARGTRRIAAISANQDWQDILYVYSGEKVTITYLSGSWSPCAPKFGFGCPFVHASGWVGKEQDPANIVPNCAHAALIARIASATPFCGSDYFSQMIDQAGILRLRINDNQITDDDGAIIVQIEIQ
ncbi:MAG: serine/threonine-protein kinase [Anaerolineae bacterium]